MWLFVLPRTAVPLLLLLCGACASGPSSGSTQSGYKGKDSADAGNKPTAAPVAAAPVVLNVSGGFAGEVHEYTLSADRTMLTAVDQKRQRRATRALSTAERTELRSLIATLDGAVAEGSSATGCADCMHYELLLGAGGGKQRAVQADSMSLGSLPQAALINRLVSLGQSALQAAANNTPQ
jgi:hypothetical protein